MSSLTCCFPSSYVIFLHFCCIDRLTHEDFFYYRCLSEHNYKLGIPVLETYQQFKSIYGSLIPELDTIRYWYREMEESGTLRTIRVSTGRPCDPLLTSYVTSALEERPSASAKEIAFKLNRSPTTIKRVLTEDLHLQKISFRWVPHDLTESHKRQRVTLAEELQSILEAEKERGYEYIVTGDESWLFLKNPPRAAYLPVGTPRPLMPKQALGAKKTMLTVFFSGNRFWRLDYLPKGVNMSGPVFVHRILAPMRAYFDANPLFENRGIVLHCDNASSHRSTDTQRFMFLNRFYPTPHPPYSPDLSPPDFFLFGDLKRWMKGQWFKSAEELEEAVSTYLLDIKPDTLYSVFDEWIHRCKEVQRTGGEYYIKRG
jgi:histone-lysine N-methyltransferase SETMAR